MKASPNWQQIYVASAGSWIQNHGYQKKRGRDGIVYTYMGKATREHHNISNYSFVNKLCVSSLKLGMNFSFSTTKKKTFNAKN